jgi:hypothetical protein
MGLTSPRQRGSACNLGGSVLSCNRIRLPNRWQIWQGIINTGSAVRKPGSRFYDFLPNFPRIGKADPHVLLSDPSLLLVDPHGANFSEATYAD